MLRNVNELHGLKVVATNGPIGEVSDFFFDDRAWEIRFFVIHTGGWLGGRKILLPPDAIQDFDRAAKVLSVSLTRERVKASPDVDTSKPVSRQHELEQFGYYGYPYNEGAEQAWGGGPRFGMSLAGYRSVRLPIDPKTQAQFVKNFATLHRNRGDDPHLRSCRAIQRYHIHATDGDIGHIDSLLVDDDAWNISYLVVDTSDWWLGHQMLIAPPWIVDISWLDATVSVDLTRKAVKDAPIYDAQLPPSPEQERCLFEHYGRSAHEQVVATTPYSYPTFLRCQVRGVGRADPRMAAPLLREGSTCSQMDYHFPSWPCSWEPGIAGRGHRPVVVRTIERRRRRAIGWSLVGVGVGIGIGIGIATTIPWHEWRSVAAAVPRRKNPVNKQRRAKSAQCA